MTPWYDVSETISAEERVAAVGTPSTLGRGRGVSQRAGASVGPSTPGGLEEASHGDGGLAGSPRRGGIGSVAPRGGRWDRHVRRGVRAAGRGASDRRVNIRSVSRRWYRGVGRGERRSRCAAYSLARRVAGAVVEGVADGVAPRGPRIVQVVAWRRAKSSVAPSWYADTSVTPGWLSGRI